MVELFPMDGEVPATMPDVVERMVQLQYTSRLRLDRRFFSRVDGQVELFDRIDAALPEGSPIREDEAYRKLRAHRRIDRFTVVSARFPSALANASDFSPTSIDARIRVGYQNALDAGLGTDADRRGPVGVG